MQSVSPRFHGYNSYHHLISWLRTSRLSAAIATEMIMRFVLITPEHFLWYKCCLRSPDRHNRKNNRIVNTCACICIYIQYIYVYTHLFIYLSIYLGTLFIISTCIFVYSSSFLSISLCIYISIYLFACVSISNHTGLPDCKVCNLGR